MGDRLISLDALKAKAFGRCKGLVHVADIDAAPTVPAIPVEWLEWRIMNAKYNGIKEAADAYEFVLKCWKEQEAK